MKLTPAQVRQVQRGEKTQHRLLVARHKQPQPGASLVIQSRRDEDPERRTKAQPEVRAQITAAPTATLQNLTTADAQAEGYTGKHALSDFMHDWMLRHDRGYRPTAPAYCTNCGGWAEYENHQGETVPCDECELGEIQILTKPDPKTIIERFEHGHAHHLVYVVGLAVETDTVRFLNQRAYLPPTTNHAEALDPTAPLLGDPGPEWRDKAEQRRKDAARDGDAARLAGLDRLHAAYQAELLRLAAETDTSDQVRGAAHTVRQQHERARQRLTNEDRRAA